MHDTAVARTMKEPMHRFSVRVLAQHQHLQTCATTVHFDIPASQSQERAPIPHPSRRPTSVLRL